jgi:hypothetical protein
LQQRHPNTSPSPFFDYGDAEVSTMSNASKVTGLNSDTTDDYPGCLGQQQDLARMVHMVLNPRSLFFHGRRKVIGPDNEEVGFLGDRTDVRQHRLCIIDLRSQGQRALWVNWAGAAG